MSPEDKEGFVGRWARLKQQARSGQAEPSGNEAPAGGTTAEETVAEAGAAPVRSPPDAASELSRPLTREDFADVDFDALDFNSDYRRFMGARVPDDIRNEALRKLWASDPVLTMHDGLDDYCGDYTDAATVPAGIVKTAYRVGKGFLSDAEVAEWEALGKPPAEEEKQRTASAQNDAPADEAPTPATAADAPASATDATAHALSRADREPVSADTTAMAPASAATKSS